VARVAVVIQDAPTPREQHANTIRSKDAKRIAARADRWKKYLRGEGVMTLAELDRLLGIRPHPRPVWLGRAGEMGEG
jgi:hypothetical protein